MPSNTTETERFTHNTAETLQPGAPELKEDQEEEALSLCDLPLLTHQHDQTTELLKSTSRTAANSSTKGDVDFHFDFGSLTTSLQELEAEMCSADEVFYRGQILPFRHSVSAGSASSSITRCPSKPMSRSGSCSGLQRTTTPSYTSSSRSSSANSSGSYSNRFQGNTSNGSPSLIVNQSHSIIPPTPPRGTKTTSDQESDDKNTTSSRFNSYFHSFPSPKPQIRTTGSTVVPPRPSFSTSNTPSSKKSSPLWEIFRLGLVRAPEIDLEGWKNRQTAKIANSNNNNRSTGSLAEYSRNSSSNSGGSSSSCDIDNGQSMQNHFTIGNYMPGKRTSGVNGCYKYDRLRPSGNNNNNNNNNNSKGRRGGDDAKQRRKKKREGRSTSSDGGGSSLFNFANYGSCRCSVGVIEPESVGTTTGPAAYISYSSSSRRRRDLISVTRDEGEESGEERKKKPSSLKKREVVVVSRHRTFEWLRDISTVGVLNSVSQ